MIWLSFRNSQRFRVQYILNTVDYSLELDRDRDRDIELSVLWIAFFVYNQHRKVFHLFS